MADPLDGANDNDAGAPVQLTITGAQAGQRLDKALALLAAHIPGLSRSRIARLIADGAITESADGTVTEAKRKVKPGESFTLDIPPALPIEPEPEDIPLAVVHEDAELIVVDKPAGMVVHPAPGAETGTLVNALLYHCGDSLSGIGGALRPGIVHRIDKQTSGLVVVAKSDAAHAGLAALFAAHDIERRYLGLAWGAAATLPPLVAVWLCLKCPWRPFAELVRVVDELLVPLFRNCRVAELAVISLLAGLGEEILFRSVIQQEGTTMDE